MITRLEAGCSSLVLRLGRRLGPIPFALLLACAIAPITSGAPKGISLPPEIAAFINNKEIQARVLAKTLNLEVSPEIWDYFRTAKVGDGIVTTNAFDRLHKRPSQPEGQRID